MPQHAHARRGRRVRRRGLRHYYFKAFYNADSGTIPARLILELLSKQRATLAELLAPFRARYFISGEINSDVADGWRSRRR